MKTTRQPFLLIITLLAIPFFAAAQDKLALLVAVSNYAPGTAWPSLHSNNDIPLLMHALQQQGFQEKNIQVIQDAEATKEGILRAIRTQLIQRATKGAKVLFHFSGHGQQVKDNNGDETDGLDEAIVPYDAPLNYQKGVYEGQLLLRDEELGLLFQELRTKLGPTGSLILLLDACHSGTGLRGEASVRGTELIMAENQTLDPEKVFSSELNAIEVQSLAVNEAQLAPFVAFFSSGANQLNYEMLSEDGLLVGPLSYAFSKAYARALPTSSFRALFEQIQLEMATHVPKQQPQADGYLDLLLAGSRSNSNKPLYSIDRANWISATQIPLKAGTLQGLFPGTKVDFYATDHPSPTQVPIASGTVTRAGTTYAIVSMEKALQKPEAAHAWALVREYSFGDLKISIQLFQVPANLQAALLDSIKSYPLIQVLNGPADLQLHFQPGGMGRLCTADQTTIFQFNSTQYSLDAQIELLIREILSFTRGKYLRLLETQHPQIKLKLELIPSSGLQLPASAGLKFAVKQKFNIKVSNTGSIGAYFTILDIQPDNRINTAIPLPNHSPAEYFLPAGQSFVSGAFDVGPPLGTEVLKLIGSSEALHLSFDPTRSRNESKTPRNTLERLLASTDFYSPRGQTPNLMLTPEVSTTTLVFSIVE